MRTLCSRTVLGGLHRHLYRCYSQPSSLISPSVRIWSGCSPPKEHQLSQSVSKRKGSFSICLIFSALVTLFCLSMLIQVFILSASRVSSGKLALESLLETHLSGSGNGLDWVEPSLMASLDAEPDEKQYQKNKAFTVEESFDYWQAVSTSPHRFFVFSAYLDNYNRSNLNRDLLFASTSADDHPDYFVRVIAVTLLAAKQKVVCCFHQTDDASRSGSRRTIREGSLRAIREHWNLKYSAFYLYCPLPREYHSESSFSRTSLSILAFGGSASTEQTVLRGVNAQPLPSNRLVIHTLAEHRPTSTVEPARMAVCVKPLHYHYNKSIHLIEFIELNRLLGVTHFYFYNHTVGPEVDQVLRHFAQQQPPLVSILPWLLPVISQKEIRTEGIFAAINDCLYRARSSKFEFAMFIDVDEFIIPHHHTDLHRLIGDMAALYEGQVAAFSFRNGFFYLQYPDDPVDVVQDEVRRRLALQLTTLCKTKRKVNLNMHKQRSKCIVVPEHTVEMGNHFVWEMTSGKHTLNVNPNMAYLFHYRVCEFGGDQCVHNSEHLTDRRVHHWASKLISRVQQHLHSMCVHSGHHAEPHMCEVTDINSPLGTVSIP